MAKRYSGDVEVRVQWIPRGRFYTWSTRSPYGRANGRIRLKSEAKIREPASSETYDRVASYVLSRMPSEPVELDDNGRVLVRRLFQAPCPIGEPKPRRRR